MNAIVKLLGALIGVLIGLAWLEFGFLEAVFLVVAVVIGW